MSSYSLILRYRALATDTLPYEVPAIFSNDQLIMSLCHSRLSEKTQKCIDSLNRPAPYTIPYRYSISKDGSGERELSLIHPASQIESAAFYERYSSIILAHSSSSEFSLRRPVALASPFVDKPTTEDAFKSGEPEPEREADIPFMSSYFKYDKYTLLVRFIESAEYSRLEARYLRLRTLDVSKCFYNIYTHSISWAVKGKAEAKRRAGAFTFEENFDKLIRSGNYNETSGIPVGAELSRVFAEVILQAVDRHILQEMRAQAPGLEHEQHYAIRRYIDDFYVYANDDATLDQIEGVISKVLREYKLHINEAKRRTYNRPFVSALSLARQELRSVRSEVASAMKEIRESTDPGAINLAMRRADRRLRDVRLIVARYGVPFSSLSGWLLPGFKRQMRQLFQAVANAEDPRVKDGLSRVIIALLKAAMAVCALDMRVRTTYSLCQIALLVKQHQGVLPGLIEDEMRHVLEDELGSMLRSLASQGRLNSRICVEACNLLICGAAYLGKAFLDGPSARQALALLTSGRPTYFHFISAKFCMLLDAAGFQAELASLNQAAISWLKSGTAEPDIDCEASLMLRDLIGSPDISRDCKRDLLTLVPGCPGQLSNAEVDELAEVVGFATWDAMAVEHLLKRRQLHPVYPW